MRSVLIIIMSLYLIADYQTRDSLIDIIKDYQVNKRDIDEKYIISHIELSREYRFVDHNTAFKILDTIAPLAKKYFPRRGTNADVYNGYGNLYFDIGDYERSVQNYYECLKIHRQSGAVGGVSFSYNDIAYVFYSQGLYQLALKFYKKAYQFALEDSEDYAQIHTLKNLGLTYARLGETDSAFFCLNQTFRFDDTRKDFFKLSQTYFYMGLIHKRNRDDLDSAKYYFEKAIEVFQINAPLYWSEGYYSVKLNLAEVNYQLGNYVLAQKNINEAEEYLFRKALITKIPEVDLTRAKIFYSQGELDSAETYLKKAFWISNEEMQIGNISNIYKNLALVYREKKQLDSFLIYHDKYHSIKDSLNQSNISKSLSTMRSNLFIDESEMENAKLQKQNKIQLILLLIVFVLSIVIIALLITRYNSTQKILIKLEEKNKELTDTNLKLDEAISTKVKFFEIMAHDLKSPISAFEGTLSLLSSDFKSFSQKEVGDILTELHSTSQQVQELLSSLLTWARIKVGSFKFNIQMDNISLLFVNIESYFKEKIKAKKIDLIVDVEKDLFIEIDSNLINTAIKEILSNSIKFTKEYGAIEIKHSMDKMYHYFVFTDTGIGMGENDLDKLFRIENSWSRPGLSGEKGTGLGLLICKEYIELHGGYIEVDSQINEGTSVTFTLPISFTD